MGDEQHQVVSGDVVKMRTMADGTLRLEVELHTPDEAAYDLAVTRIARVGVPLALARLTAEAGLKVRQPGAGEGEPSRDKPAEKPYGQQAQSLYRNGFLQAPPVLRALGSEDVFEEWLRGQLCVVCGDGDWHEQTGEIRNEPAHIRRVAAGSGTGTKPPYHAVPACHEHHRLQHDQGYLAAAKVAAAQDRYRGDLDEEVALDWFHRQAVARKQEWAKARLRAWFQVESLGQISPAELAEWARSVGAYHLLPEEYRDAEHVPG